MSGFLHTAIILALTTRITTCTPTPTVHAPWGTVQGVVVEGDEGRRMNGYLGIPFAQPPVRDLRFEKPRPHPGPGPGQVFVADQIAPACLQEQPIVIGSAQKVSEDCLTLNVYVPVGGENSASLHAVMVFIHGGGFSMGDAASYRPSRLVVDEKVIVVTIQYRLGSLGFLSSGDDALPGNLALWDQNLALRWAQANVRAFRGDPDSVTVFGESAGSFSIGLHLLSPQSRGLFKRAIMQSGSPEAIPGMLSVLPPRELFQAVAEEFQCGRDTSREVVECLKQVPALDYFSGTLGLVRQAPMGGAFFPVVDGDFLPTNLNELVSDEQYRTENGLGEVDILMGVNNREGSLVPFMLGTTRPLTFEELSTPGVFRAIADLCLGITLGVTSVNEVLRKTVEFHYRGADAFNDSAPVPTDTVTTMLGDSLFVSLTFHWLGRLAEAKESSKSSGVRYLYVLDHHFLFNQRGPMPGAHHLDELFLQFDSGALLTPDGYLLRVGKAPVVGEERRGVGNTFVKICTDFAKTGNPGLSLQGTLGSDDWPQFTADSEAYLAVSMNPQVMYEAGPYRDRNALWQTLVPELAALTAQLKASGRREQKPQGSKADDEL